MRHVRTLIAGAAATAAALSVAGLSATAQAQPVSQLAGGSDPSVPAGVATSVHLAACSSGPVTVTSSPALPASVHSVVNGTKAQLAGVWPKAATFKITLHCGGGVTKAATVTVAAAPPENAAVGLGAQTQQGLIDQFTGDYNATIGSSGTHLYYWDAVNPVTGQIGDTIAVKAKCPSIPRPNGSSAGITQLATFTKTSDGKFLCDNFVGSSRPRGSSDPAFAPGGVAFVALAGDAVTWATPKTSDAPASLTTAQLAAIFTCADTNWSQVGGKNAPIKPFLPQTGAGTLTFWLAALGGITPGPCVSNNNNTLEENEGIDPVLQTPEAIWIYSVGDYIAQKFHSPKCTNSSCTGTPPCVPAANKDLFSCDQHGTYVAREINGVAPTTGSGVNTVINSAFPAAFDRTLFEVVPYDPSTADHIPGSESGAPGGVNLEKIFGHTGWACTNKGAKANIKSYGFVPLPTCGATS
jgi:ABC-type phosphate transport system substrate-binding protein